MKRAQWTLFLAFAISISLMETASGQGDFYIRSQFTNGPFIGFHEILAQPKDGYHQAQYCDRTFWVTSGTVAWTEEQVTAGNILILEENLGPDRMVVCADSSAFATLDELGLKKKEIEKIRGKNKPLDMKSSRLRTIRDAFKQFK